MIGLLMAAAVLAAVAGVGWRRWQRIRTAAQRPGARRETPIVVTRFDEIDAAVQTRPCIHCGGYQSLAGETSQVVGERRLRIVRIVCSECERDERVYFDVTAIFH